MHQSTQNSALRIPAPLQLGDRLCVISPSGTLREREAFDAGIKIWQDQGYQIDYAEGYDSRWGYLAGTDKERRSQLQQAWINPDCKGILCSRGGYGGSRLLEQWQWPAKANDGSPLSAKWIIGFSDITSLLWSLYIHGISGVHGPLLTTLCHEPEWSIQRLFAWVEGRFSTMPALEGDGWIGGQASGLLLPANLTVATHLLGTSLQPNLDGVILALEDVGEAPYRIDRMLTQWRMMGALEKIKGIALGRFSKCKGSERIPSLTIEEVLRDRLCDLNIPIVANLPFGHDGVNAALPVGVQATLDGTTGQLKF
ncbi:MAG: LD-carboxypeptidase [Cyanobacteria bacterium P01_F01_bin.150]